jgi:hypothetical protein
MVEAQQRVMKIERRELEVVATKRFAILERATFLEKGLKIPNLE